MSTVEKTLRSLGFSANEINVYLELNKSGSEKAGRIAKKIHMDRSSCYNSLSSLTDKGLVSYVLIGNVKWYQATGPKMLRDYVKSQLRSVEEILPELHNQHKAGKLEGQVRLFKGKKGVRAVFMDIIRTGENNLVFGSEGQLTKKMPEFSKQFSRLKKENNIRTHLICRAGRKELSSPRSVHKYLNVKESPAVTNIYGDKIAIIIWTDEPEAVVIENEAAALAYRSYFDVLWKVSKS